MDAVTRYLDPSFPSRPASDAYRDGWERVGGKEESMSEDERGWQVDWMLHGADCALRYAVSVLMKAGKRKEADLVFGITPGETLPEWAQDFLQQRGLLHTSEEETP